MALEHLNSANIQIFPAVARSDAYQKDARLFTEESVTKPFKLMYNNESFVISTKDNINTDNILEFVIGGYYVKIADFQNAFSSILTSNGTLYAGIKLATTNGYTELVGTDNNGVYQGVEFSTVSTDFDANYKTLSICDVTVSGTIQATSINTPAQVGGEKSEIILPNGSTTPSNLEKGETYLDTNSQALYIGLGNSNNLELRAQGNTSDITAETITLSKSGGIASLVIKDTTNSPTVTINGDTGSGTYTGKANIQIVGDVTVTTGSVTTEEIYAENASIDKLDGETEIPSGQKLINNGTITNNGGISGSGNISTNGGDITATTVFSPTVTRTTTINGMGINTNGSLNATTINGGDITVPSGQTLEVKGTTKLGTTTTSGKLTVSSGGASITGATTISGDTTVTGGLGVTSGATISSIGNGNIKITGDYLKNNGYIARMYSTNIPSDLNSAECLETATSFGEYLTSVPLNSPLPGAFMGFVALEVFPSTTSGYKYAMQKLTYHAGDYTGFAEYVRVMRRSTSSSSWSVWSDWRQL